MPYINRIFQSLEKLAAYEDKLTGATNSVELIKSGNRVTSFFRRLWGWMRRRRPAAKPTLAAKTNPAASTAAKTNPAASAENAAVNAGKPAATAETATTNAANTAAKTETAAANTAAKTETAAANTATNAENAAANTAAKTETAVANAENAAANVENAAANAAEPGLLARHPYMAMAGSAGAAGLATYWLAPTKHYTPPSPNDYAHLTERYQQLPYIT